MPGIVIQLPPADLPVPEDEQIMVGVAVDLAVGQLGVALGLDRDAVAFGGDAVDGDLGGALEHAGEGAGHAGEGLVAEFAAARRPPDRVVGGERQVGRAGAQGRHHLQGRGPVFLGAHGPS